MEFDINVHNFGNVPKQGLQVMFNRFDSMVISIGFCIESLTDEEMPETMFGVGTVVRPMPTEATNWDTL